MPEEESIPEDIKSERPTTPQRRRTWSIPGRFIQSPAYQRTGGVEPSNIETIESQEQKKQQERKGKDKEQESSSQTAKEKHQEDKDRNRPEDKENKPSMSTPAPKEDEELRGVKIPFPKTLTGDGDDRGARTVNTWINRVKDWINVTKTKEKNKPVVLQYFLDGSALDFYETKREAARNSGKDDLDVNEFYEQLRKQYITSTTINEYWRDWGRISQIDRNGKIRRITEVANQIEKIANWIGTDIGPAVKIQKFLEAMNQTLRAQVEPLIKERKEKDWPEIKELAEKHDAVLYENKQYKRTNDNNGHRQAKTAAIERPKIKFNQRNKTRPKNTNRQNFNSTERDKLRKEGRCYTCKGTGHYMNKCPKRNQNRKYQTARTEVIEKDDEPTTLEEYMKTLHEPETAAMRVPDEMVATFKYGKKEGPTLLDTGTKGANFLSNQFVQSNGIHTTKLEPSISIRLATKGSKTTAKDEVTMNVEIAKGITVRVKFLIIPLKSYAAIMGMPFLQQFRVTLDPANGEAKFGSFNNYIIKCQRYSTAATVTSTATTVRTAATHTELHETELKLGKLPNFKEEFPEVFPEKEPEGLPPSRGECDHEIPIIAGKESEFKRRYVPVAEAWLPQLREHLNKWQRYGIAVVGEGQFACPTFAVPKAGRNEPRWVHDLRQRNKITQRDYTMIPEQRRMLESAARARCLSVLDLTDAYHQIRIKPNSEKYNTINTPFGCYSIRVMLQGDTNAPATMMRNMTKIFGDIIGKYIWVYLDDVIVFSNNHTQHISHLREVFQRLQENSFYLKLEKCQFMLKRIKLLGHYIERGRIVPAKEQIEKIQDWRSPTSRKQLQSFIGLVNYIAPHLPHAATIQSQLTELTGSNVEWEWLPMHEHAFNQLKRLCDQSISLKPLDYEQIKKGSLNAYLVTDASKVGTGAFICHGQTYEDAKRNIAALHSRKFNSSQGNYNTTDQECLAIVDALKAFETRLLGVPFTIITDHQALQYLISNEIKSSRQMRWMDYIQRFNFEIRYEPGGTNLLADALSRIYYDISKDEIQPEEQVVDMDDNTERSKEDLNAIESPTETEHQNGSNQQVEDKISKIQFFTKPLSLKRESASIPHVMAMAIPKRPECDIGLHWALCKLRRGKGTGCPFHYSTGRFTTHSDYLDLDIYTRNLDEWDRKYGPSSSSNNTETSRSGMVQSQVSGIQKRNRRSRRQMAQRFTQPSSESADKMDEDGYPRKIEWISKQNYETKEESPLEESSRGNTPFRILQGRMVKDEAASHVITRSKRKHVTIQKDPEEGSRELVIQQPIPTRTIQEDIAKLEDAIEDEELKEVDSEESDKRMKEEWLKNYTKDLILPRGGLPQDLLTGVVRVVDGKHYHLDQYLDKEMEGGMTPLEVNIYHAGNTDSSLLPKPFQNIDYSTAFGKAFFEALAKDPAWTACRASGGQPFNSHPLGYILFQRPGKGIRVYIPEGPFTPEDTGIESTIRTTIIAEAHHELAHLGTQKTYLHIAPHCYWPKMFKDVEKYVQTCSDCQLNKQPTTRPAGVAHVLPIPERPWQSIAIDFIGPITASQGYTNIMVIVDRFSGFLLCFPLKNKFNAVDVADTFLFTFYGRFGLPESIVSDRDPRFTGKFWESLMETLGIKLLMSTAFHQETNGQVERTNKTIMQMLRIFGNSSGTDWASNLWRAEHGHNMAQSTWTDRSPYEIVYGKAPNEIPEHLPESTLPAVERYLDNLIVNHKVAHDALILARYRTAETVNKRRNPNISFKEGDYVLYQRRTMDKNKSKKLQSIWVGPYKVIAVSGETGNCKLDIPRQLKIHPWFATDKLKLFHARNESYPSPVIEDKEKEYEEEYEVDKVLDYDEERNRYLVSWRGYGPEDNQWEPAEHLRNAPDKTAEYWAYHSQNISVSRAFRKANQENSKIRRKNVHSRLVLHTPAEFFYPSDDTDGEGIQN